jgi:hypothetical protein
MSEILNMPMPARCRVVPLRQPRNPADAEALQNMLGALRSAASADQHTVLAPTHLVIKGDEIVGYGSLGGLPTLHLWLDSHKVHAADSLRLLETAEALLADKNVRQVLVPCSEQSPFAQHMERLGFKKLGTTTLFTKEF